MRSRKPFLWLIDKEWRELVTSRAWWLLLLLMGPLTGVSFIGAVRTYSEVSGLNGTSAGVGEALAPLIGVWVPTFSSLELAAVFLLPFVAIRIVGADRQSGALRLELQGRVSPIARIFAKAIVALAGWLVAMAPMFLAMVLWLIYGGSMYPPEMASVIGGHMLNAGLTVALGFAAASITEHPSTAAIVTLAVTVGTWILNFFAALQGGYWERAAAYTPAVMVSSFGHGLVELNAILVGLLLVLTGLGIAAIWQRLGVRVSRRLLESLLFVGAMSAAIVLSSFARANWDLSENRGNSFPLADEVALRGLRSPLKIQVNLAPEDPRRADLERRAFSKLRRVVPGLDIEYSSATGIGLFEQTREGYGELRYSVNGRSSTSRVTTAEGVLESIYETAQISLPKDVHETVFRGHPLAVPPVGAAALFYGLWPGLVLLAGLLVRRKYR